MCKVSSPFPLTSLNPEEEGWWLEQGDHRSTAFQDLDHNQKKMYIAVSWCFPVTWSLEHRVCFSVRANALHLQAPDVEAKGQRVEAMGKEKNL